MLNPAFLEDLDTATSEGRSRPSVQQIDVRWQTVDPLTFTRPMRTEFFIKITERQRFDHLARQWLSDTRYSSSSRQMKDHPAFDVLVGMGPIAVEEIILRMKRGQLYQNWFLLLKALAGEDPVPTQYRGVVPEMAQAWIAWAEKKNQT